MIKNIGLTLATVGLLFAAAVAHASPVAFSVQLSSLTIGSGYGIDADEATGTKLDARFTTNTTPYSFTLNNPGDSQEFVIGNVAFLEPLLQGGINGTEATGNLNISALFAFSSPYTSNEMIAAAGVGYVGIVEDGQVDFRLNAEANTFEFGNGGSFDFTLVSMSFNNTNQTRSLVARITLNALAANQVPEPASLALLGIALAGFGMARRKRG